MLDHNDCDYGHRVAPQNACTDIRASGRPIILQVETASVLLADTEIYGA